MRIKDVDDLDLRPCLSHMREGAKIGCTDCKVVRVTRYIEVKPRQKGYAK